MRFPFCIRATNTVDSCKRTEEVLVKKFGQGITDPEELGGGISNKVEDYR